LILKGLEGVRLPGDVTSIYKKRGRIKEGGSWKDSEALEKNPPVLPRNKI